jgi:hypothetical protein
MWRMGDRCATSNLHREDFARGQIREIPRIVSVVIRVLRVGEIVHPRHEREILQVRKQSSAGIPAVAGS